MAKDPVCGMDVDPSKTTLVATHEGKSYYFCAPSCLKSFKDNPARYLASAAAPSTMEDSHHGHGAAGGGKKHGCC
ncbi:MAG: YHS domain-containing protein [Chloroflexi bacterium]|nr:YHS domain-containing protein [Chloroflexota bacterium]